MGAMRFPPTEEALFYYLNKFNIPVTSTFPDPGKFPTWVSYQGNGQLWSNASVAPNGFERVRNGWLALVSNGITNKGTTVFESSSFFNTNLRESPINGIILNSVISEWQKYLTEFENDSFYTGLMKIFGPQHKWDVPSDALWSEEDFTRFGALGIGSGGFGPLYSIGFLYIYRLLTNALETNQAFVPDGISSVCEALLKEFTNDGGNYKSNTRVIGFTVSEQTPTPRPGIVFEDKSPTQYFDYVIVATTTRAMEMGMNLSDYLPNTFIVAPQVSEAINRTHVISSTKLFLRTKKFWSDTKYPRNILSDTKLPQLYTLDYGEPDSGVVLVTYTWEDDAIKTQALSPLERLNLLKEEVRVMTVNTPFSDFADQLIPYTGDYDRDLRSIDWQSTQDYFGAFTLARPGQDHYVDTMFRDFGKATSLASNDAIIPLFIAGDCISWSGGWSEGAFHTGLNAAAAVIQAAKGQFTISDNPITKLISSPYNYFPG